MIERTAAQRAMRRPPAAGARGETSFESPVGCVVPDADANAGGTGYHAGRPHAEIVAPGTAGARARGGTLVVTAEPCDHHGRTGPCTRAAVETRRVVYAVDDPVAGAGALGHAHRLKIDDLTRIGPRVTATVRDRARGAYAVPGRPPHRRAGEPDRSPGRPAPSRRDR